jgi:hypothetical protein
MLEGDSPSLLALEGTLRNPVTLHRLVNHLLALGNEQLSLRVRFVSYVTQLQGDEQWNLERGQAVVDMFLKRTSRCRLTGIPETVMMSFTSSLQMLTVVRRFVLKQLTTAPEVMGFLDF